MHIWIRLTRTLSCSVLFWSKVDFLQRFVMSSFLVHIMGPRLLIYYIFMKLYIQILLFFSLFCIYFCLFRVKCLLWRHTRLLVLLAVTLRVQQVALHVRHSECVSAFLFRQTYCLGEKKNAMRSVSVSSTVWLNLLISLDATWSFFIMGFPIFPNTPFSTSRSCIFWKTAMRIHHAKWGGNRSQNIVSLLFRSTIQNASNLRTHKDFVKLHFFSASFLLTFEYCCELRSLHSEYHVPENLTADRNN